MNYGKWYYRDYFYRLRLDNEGQLKVPEKFGHMNDPLVGVQRLEQRFIEPLEGVKGFKLKTTYPGLLCGIGYHHEVNRPKEEGQGKKKDEPLLYQLGLYFDYSSGLPVIPGSSIKGALRSAIEEWEFFKGANTDKPWSGWNAENFVKAVFEGKGQSIYERDIFLDAIPIEVSGQGLFGEDYITHHPSPLKEPNPVRFLRVNPGVTYLFRFILRDSAGFEAKDKLKLFEEIILALGLGAKTNVGYGRFQK